QQQHQLQDVLMIVLVPLIVTFIRWTGNGADVLGGGIAVSVMCNAGKAFLARTRGKTRRQVGCVGAVFSVMVVSRSIFRPASAMVLVSGARHALQMCVGLATLDYRIMVVSNVAVVIASAANVFSVFYPSDLDAGKAGSFVLVELLCAAASSAAVYFIETACMGRNFAILEARAL
ncbi:unnamed protein product, partial [Polarella glacialis]